MNVSLTPELEGFVKTLVDTGRYQSASEVVREGLRLLEGEERRRLLEKTILEGLTGEEETRLPSDLLEKVRADVRRQIEEGLESAGRGELRDGEEFFSKRRARTTSSKAM